MGFRITGKTGGDFKYWYLERGIGTDKSINFFFNPGIHFISYCSALRKPPVPPHRLLQYSEADQIDEGVRFEHKLEKFNTKDERKELLLLVIELNRRGRHGLNILQMMIGLKRGWRLDLCSVQMRLHFQGSQMTFTSSEKTSLGF